MLDPSALPEVSYKLAHKNHPCSIWVRESLSNYMWLADLGYWLCQEYRFRYGDKTHKTEAHLDWLRKNPPQSLEDVGITEIRLAMPIEYKRPNPVEAYRMYYRENKLKVRGIVRYSKRDPPGFLMLASA